MPDHAMHPSSSFLWVVACLAVACLVAACGDAPLDAPVDVLEDTAAEVVSCACDGGCPTDLCDVRVALASNCSLTFEVVIHGELVGEASAAAPFSSCEAWPCDAQVEIEVRGGGFSTGTKTLPVFLDPDVPLDCANLGL